MTLNKEELGIGAVYGLAFSTIYSWWSILIVPIVSVLWALGGATGFSKSYRRLGVSSVIGISLALITGSWVPLLSIIPAFGVLTIGYGIPDYFYVPHDDGSFLGRIFWKWFNKDDYQASCALRSFLAFLFALCFISICWLGYIPHFIVAIVFISMFTSLMYHVLEGEIHIG